MAMFNNQMVIGEILHFQTTPSGGGPKSWLGDPTDPPGIRNPMEQPLQL
jgi:hypothetical protein